MTRHDHTHTPARAAAHPHAHAQQVLAITVTPLARCSECGRSTPRHYDKTVRGGGSVRVPLCGECASR